MTFIACIDASIVNVAIHTISQKLGVDLAAMSWVVISYLIAISATVLIFGRLGDALSKVAVFKFGIVLFTIGSLLCGLAGSLPFLLAARVVQGIGAAASMATNQGIITHVFPDHERGRALGLTGSSVALGNLLGPGLGGVIVSSLDWHTIFLINIPLGIVAFLVGQKVLPKRTRQDLPNQQEKLRDPGSMRLRQAGWSGKLKGLWQSLSKDMIDGKGAGLSAGAIILFILAINLYRSWGLADPKILGMFAGVVVLAALFIVVEKRHPGPLVDLSLFKNKLYSLSVFCSLVSFVTLSFMTILVPFYLQDVLEITPLFAGFLMMSAPLVMMIIAPLSGYASDKIGSEALTFFGQCIMVLGLGAAGILVSGSSPAWLIVLLMAVVTMGSAIFQSPNTSLIMSQVPREMLGVSGSINALMRNVGMVTGVSMSTSLLYFFMSTQVGYRVEKYAEGLKGPFVNAMHGVFLVAACLCLVGVVLTGLRLWSMRRREAQR
jgi:MFS family permease